jgi:hypothetical protein
MIQREHAIPVGALRPDLVIRRSRGTETTWVLVEVKGGTRAGEASARAAAYDLLAYRTAFAPALQSQESPYGLGIAWGAELQPRQAAGQLLCSPDTLSVALGQLFA